jgi:hypothetical protein
MTPTQVAVGVARGFLYSAFAKTFLALGRIDFAARLRWLFDLLDPRAITGSANSFSQKFTRLFHQLSIVKTKRKVEFIGPKLIAAARNNAMKLGS